MADTIGTSVEVKPIINSAQPVAADSGVSEKEYMRDPYKFWQGVPLSSGFKTNARVAQAGVDVNASAEKGDGDVVSSANQRAFIGRVALATSNAQSKLNSITSSQAEFFMQLSESPDGIRIVSASRVPQGGRFPIHPATRFIAHWHYAGLNIFPDAGDHSAARKGMSSFVVTFNDMKGDRCCATFEVGRQGGNYMYREFRGEKIKDWKANPYWGK